MEKKAVSEPDMMAEKTRRIRMTISPMTIPEVAVKALSASRNGIV
jgi:hypothetical protein